MIKNGVAGVAILLLIGVQSIASVQLEEAVSLSNSTGERSERFLSLFSVVRFSNSFCYGSNGFNGTCLTSAECSSTRGGTASGSCASGFGVCCTIFVSTCGTTITRNNTYWVQPGWNNSYTTPGQCSVYVKKCNPNICQLRLDFVNFAIEGPNGIAQSTATQCLIDVFTVSGQSNNVPGICGYNTGQHIYVDMTPGNNQFSLNMLLTGSTTSRAWNIRIAQIPCGTTYTAPDNCLQWFTDSVGTFRSFNYRFNTMPLVQHLANQDYTICIRMNQGFCGICYQVCDVPSDLFMTTAGVTTPSPFNLATTPDPAIDAACTTDFIQIPCAVNFQSSGVVVNPPSPTPLGCRSKICGTGFNTAGMADTNLPVYSYRKPFEVRFYTDSNEGEDPTDMDLARSLGFCLKYQQLSCTSG